jgi:hypothetical protein
MEDRLFLAFSEADFCRGAHFTLAVAVLMLGF